VGFLHFLFVCSMDGISASFPQFPDGVSLPLGIYSKTEREFFQFLCFSEIANQGVDSGGGCGQASPVAPRLTPHTVFT